MSTSEVTPNGRLGRLRRILRRNLKKETELSDIHRIESFKIPYNDQHSSSLFSVLPVEVRDAIFMYALSDYEDMTRPYAVETCYRRPEYMAPRKTETALLRTCQAIYCDAWYWPWTQARHTFFLTAGGRKPMKTTETSQMERTLRLIEKLHPDVPARSKEVSNIQIFAQLYLLEPGQRLSHILQISHFSPRTVTITLRHTDMWHWEQDAPIHIKSPWVSKCRFPASVTNVRLQLESIERRKPQVDYVANKIREDWHFTRTDDTHLVCDVQAPLEELRWVGSSTWEDLRWIRDEDDREPGVLHYYVATLSFKPANFISDATGYEARKQAAIPPRVDVPPNIAARTQIPGGGGGHAYLHVVQIRRAGVTSDTPASGALKKVQEWSLETARLRGRE
ncbi:hypothetical protein LTR70_000313 [Exophiala xenobiotica]|uniref:Uncharacterized protein n=1 Tax=Lithohypha guttulata TaxID=1690604 RepID=A0ABR0KPI5_9EURO|nr:hypothetical protein LTR24_000016 [Lithohypha guttulata]KAK5330483.1 hypothetical protein LTR70_000313 [Exophiala xenobiotica]